MTLDLQAYQRFLESKMAIAPRLGLDCDPSEVNPILKPHQRDSVVWGVRGGRRAWFEAFGLGKTVIQLEALRIITKKDPGLGLIVCPLGVRQEFKRDAEMLGIKTIFVRSDEDLKRTFQERQHSFSHSSQIFLTNYESIREKKLDPGQFKVISLDEAAILRGFGGTKTFRSLMQMFEGSATYRFVATATPSPNEYIELLAYAAFLGIMDVSQAKAQPLDAKILTPGGWKAMGDIHVGDDVIAGDGAPTRVLGVFAQGRRPIYRVIFNDGGATECDGEHLWLTHNQYERNNEARYRKGTGRKTARHTRSSDFFATVKTTNQIAATLKDRTGWNHSIPLVSSVQFPYRKIEIDPWLLGLLLGDSCIRSTSVTLSTMDQWILNARNDARRAIGATA